ncbi:hypothetical protein SAMN05444004_1317 [Jannaschia faecimaris]|uniref:Uncharacterized protein n=1 Tax=Jannaschia faecimaris TaxID=1244108 RepID=A0A1H3UGI6_9RHOB|nr:hypothetical protein [Jannaschia faecimaris]SDZ60759.1 hypothetical protein SAMN05444004_1317 [Jannaschia faecimaris]
MTRLRTSSFAAAIALIGSATFAGTELETALNNGGERLTADQISELLIGNTVTAISGDKTFRFFYDPSNVVTGELTNGGWEGTGSFAITDADNICVSMAADKGRFRCLTVVRDGEILRKFDKNGKMTFELVDFEPSTGL